MNNSFIKGCLYSSSGSAVLYHSGKQGMHWHIRNYQPYDQGYHSQSGGVYVGPRKGLFGKLFSKGKGVADYYKTNGLSDLKEGFSQLKGKVKNSDTLRQLSDVGSEYARRGKEGLSRFGKKASSVAGDLYKGIKGSGTLSQSLQYLATEGKKKVDAGSKFIDSVRLGARRHLSDINEHQRFNGITPKQAIEQALSGINGLVGKNASKRSTLPELSDINQRQKDTVRTLAGAFTRSRSDSIGQYWKDKSKYKYLTDDMQSLIRQVRGIDEAESNKGKRYAALTPEGKSSHDRIRETGAELEDWFSPEGRKGYESGAYRMGSDAKSLLSQLGDINQSKKASSIGTSSTSGRSALMSQLSGIDQTKKLSDIGWFDWDSQSSKKKSSGGYSMGSGGGFKISF